MKKSIGLMAALAVLSISAQAHASCTSAAVWAAETLYGNDPIRTRTVAVIPNKEYRVTVGIGNAEDGAHTYRVVFKDGSCDPRTALVCDLTQVGNDTNPECPGHG